MPTPDTPSYDPLTPILRRILTATLCLCLLYLVLTTWSWPFVGDAAYIHYIAFLLHHGLHPYRDIVDMNTPGTYLVEQTVLASLGSSALAWRFFDLLLMAALTAASLYLLAEEGLLAGLFAATLFLTIHAQDGVQMLAERDLQVAVALVCSLALLTAIHHIPRPRQATIAALATAASLCAAAAISIKPTAALTVLALAAWLHLHRPRIASATLLFCLTTPAFLLIPILWLVHHQALTAFLSTLTTLVRYHASLDPRPLTYLLPHSVSPILALVLLWLLLRVAIRLQKNPAPTPPTLILCVVTALLSYLLQRKGFSYQRYPFLIFFILLLARDLFRRHTTRPQQFLAVIGIATGLIMAVFFTHRASTFSHTPPNQQLQADLSDLAAHGAARIQCMDTAGGCIAALYQERLVQDTGFLYDCYFLDPTNPVARSLRERFFTALATAPPQAIIVTDSVCYDQPRSFSKFARWPEFEQYLANHYTLASERSNLPPEHYWSRTTTPFDYRIYLRR
jgi:hypothetical protein